MKFLSLILLTNLALSCSCTTIAVDTAPLPQCDAVMGMAMDELSRTMKLLDEKSTDTFHYVLYARGPEGTELGAYVVQVVATRGPAPRGYFPGKGINWYPAPVSECQKNGYNYEVYMRAHEDVRLGA